MPSTHCLLHLQVQAALSTYAARFKQMKAPRQLVWRHTAGLVKLAVTLDDRRLELSVSPLHATILLHFRVSLSGACVGPVCTTSLPYGRLQGLMLQYGSQRLVP